MYKLSIDAMSGDLGSSIVVEACEMFMKNQKTSLCKSYIFLVNTISLLLISFF